MTQDANAQIKPENPLSLERAVAPNPYVGPRPFTSAERDRFFGREQEARQLIPLMIAERLVLFYAQSGAGKSSLINARLVPGLVERNFKVLTGRVSGQSAEGAQADNIFIYNLLLSFEIGEHGASAKNQPDARNLPKMTLAEYLADMDIEPAPAEPQTAAGESGGTGGEQDLLVDAPQTIAGVQPLALIIDQFEEIFTTNPGAWSQRKPFFEQISAAMEGDPYLWVVFSIREDYIAALDPYAEMLPGKLRARFYMQRMGYRSALEAVCRPVEQLRPFEDDATDELVRNLSMITVGKDSSNHPILQLGQFIEPVQLQVVCYQLWEELRSRPGEHITKEDLLSLARGKDLAQFISTALANYYVVSLHDVMKQFPDIPERRLREWFTRELITETETRSAVRQGTDCTGSPPNDLDNAVVKALQDRFIIRTEIRGENTWYELSHDRFVAPILQSNREWMEKNSRPVEVAAQAWFDSREKDVSRLYDGRQLQSALYLLRDHPDDLSDKAQKFIQASQAAAEKRRKAGQRRLIGGLVLLLMVLSVLTAISLTQWRAATAQRDIAQAQKQTANAASGLAVEQKSTAIAASGLAIEQKSTAEAASAQEASLRQAAEQARGTAEAAKNQAEVASTQAVLQRDKALMAQAVAQGALNQVQGSRLASLSDYFRDQASDITHDDKLNLSLLLAIQSIKVSGGWEGHRALLNGLQKAMTNRVVRVGFPWYVDSKPYSVAISPDGEQVAVSSIRNINLWNVTGQGRVGGIPSNFTADFSMYSVAYDSTGNYLARAGGDGEIHIWNRSTGEITVLRPFQYAFSSILSVAFQPGGDLIAAVTDVDPVSKRGLLVVYNYKTRTNAPLATRDCGVFACMVVAWSPDGSKLAVGSKGGSIQVFDAALKNSLMNVERAHTGEITGLAWYPDGKRVISGAIDSRFILWDVAGQKTLLQTSSRNTPIIISLALSPDGRYLLAGINEKGTWFGLWDAETLQRLNFQFSGHTQPVSSVAFNPQGSLFVTAGYDNTIILWRFENVESLSKQVSTLTLSGAQVEGVFQGPDGKLNYALTRGKSDVQTLVEGGDKPVVQAAPHTSLEMVSIDGKQAAALGRGDGQVSFLDSLTGQPVREPVKAASGSIRSLAVSADGKLLAVAACQSSTACGQVMLWDMDANRALPLKGDLSQQNLGDVTSLAFSPNAKTLALGSSMGKIFFYNVDTGKTDPAVTEGLSLQNTTLSVTRLAFSSTDENLLVAGFNDGRLAMWEASSHGPIGEFLERANGRVTGLLFRKDPQDGLLRLISASDKGEVREWAIDEQAWISRACQIAGRNFTPEEKAKFLQGSLKEDVCPAK